MDGIFIEDGMTREGVVARSPGLHGSLKFSYRPALAETRYTFLKGPDDGGKAYTDRVCTLLEEHVTSWDAKRGKAEVKASADVIRRLHPNVLNSMLDQVLGYAGPEQESAEKN